VRYELTSGDGDVFSVNRATGDVRLRRPLRGLLHDYELIVAAYDGGQDY
jgi:hypothetical protein